jgi:hypothetical protein
MEQAELDGLNKLGIHISGNPGLRFRGLGFILDTGNFSESLTTRAPAGRSVTRDSPQPGTVIGPASARR